MIKDNLYDISDELFEKILEAAEEAYLLEK